MNGGSCELSEGQLGNFVMESDANISKLDLDTCIDSIDIRLVLSLYVRKGLQTLIPA